VTPRRIGWTAALIAIAVSTLWGGNVVALKLGLLTFPPIWSAFWRMLVGALVVGVWALSQRISLRPQAGETGVLLALGALFTVQIGCLNFGVNLTSAAYGVVLLNSYPIFANIGAHFFVPGDRLSTRRAIGLALSFAGVCLVFLGRPEGGLAANPMLGNVVVIASAMMLGCRVVFTQRIVQSMEPVRPVFWQMAISVPAFLLVASLTEPPAIQPVNWPAFAAVIYQGAVVAGLCFVIWTLLLKRYSPGALSMFGFIAPFVGVILSALLFGEAITPRLWGGVMLVVMGIALFTRERGPAAEQSVAALNEEAV
jgi:drug/metabolite transporter (DMT)-like permease